MVDTERQEPRIGNQEDGGGVDILLDRFYRSLQEEIRKRDWPPTGGPVCFSCGDDGHRANQCPQVNTALPHVPRDGLLNLDNGQYRGTGRNQKLVEGPGNEQRSEREGHPLGPPEIKAPLTQVGVSTEISNGNPIGIYRGKIVSEATGRPIVRNFRPWRRRGIWTGGMRPAKDIQPVPRGNRNARTRGVQKTIMTPLSALAENLTPRKMSWKQSTPHVPTDNELDRSLAKTGSIKVETPQDGIKSDLATIGMADPTEIDKPVAMADVAESSGPAVTGAGGPVVAGTRFLAVADITRASGPKGTEAGGPVMTGTRFLTVTDVAETSGPAGAGGLVVTGTQFRAVPDVAGASGPAVTGAGGPVVTGAGFRTVTKVAGASGLAGTGAGGPVVAGTQFLAVAEVYAPLEETEADLQGDIGRVDQISKIPEEKNGSHPLEHSGVVEGTDISDGIRKRNIPEGLEIYTDPTPVRETVDEEPIGYSAHSRSPNEWSEPLNTDGTEDTEDGDAIMVGVVGSAAPWFLTGWTNDVEVEFMIDTSCQVTILATSVFEKMCKVHPQVKSRLSLCTRRLVSADSSP